MCSSDPNIALDIVNHSIAHLHLSSLCAHLQPPLTVLSCVARFLWGWSACCVVSARWLRPRGDVQPSGRWRLRTCAGRGPRPPPLPPPGQKYGDRRRRRSWRYKVRVTFAEAPAGRQRATAAARRRAPVAILQLHERPHAAPRYAWERPPPARAGSMEIGTGAARGETKPALHSLKRRRDSKGPLLLRGGERRWR